MKNWMMMIVACVACGCATQRQLPYFPAEALEPDDATLLASVLREELDEQPFWSPDGSLFPELHIAYRLTIISSDALSMCMTIHRGGYYNAILTTKIYVRPSKDALQTHASGLVFNESRILTDAEEESFDRAYSGLELAADNEFPPDLVKLFAWLDGTTYFLEACTYGHYRIIKACDPPPPPLKQDAKECVNRMFPDVDIEDVEAYMQGYVNVLHWFAKATNVARLWIYKGIPNQVPEDTGRKLPDPQH